MDADENMLIQLLSNRNLPLEKVESLYGLFQKYTDVSALLPSFENVS